MICADERVGRAESQRERYEWSLKGVRKGLPDSGAKERERKEEKCTNLQN